MSARKIFFTVLIIIASLALVFILLVSGLQLLFDQKPVVANNTVLRIDVSGSYSEYAPEPSLGLGLTTNERTMHALYKGLAMAQVDNRIRGIYLRVGLSDMGWGKAQELRARLLEFKNSGKFIVAFIESCNEKSYYIALAADQIYAQPQAFCELNGFVAEVPFYKRMFNKIGVEPQVENIGRYKSSGDILKRESMSPAHREATLAVLQDVYDTFVDAVSDNRHIERQVLEAALDGGMIWSEEAFDHRLLDELLYETDVLDSLKYRVYKSDKTPMDESLELLGMLGYSRIPASEVGLAQGEQIALIYGVGAILPGGSGYSPLSGRIMGAQSTTRMIRQAARDDNIRALVLRLDTPGGTPSASDEIWAEIERASQKKPVVISMSDVAASGGYWLSTAGDVLVAQPLSLTASIGVVTSLYDLSGTYDKLGIVWESVQIGQNADFLTNKKPLSPEARRRLQQMTRKIYHRFVQKVADGRGQTWDEVEDVARGRVWTGKRALQYGLVDSLGGLETALALAKEKAGLSPDTQTQWVVFPKRKGLLQTLLERVDAKVSGRLSRDWLQVLPAQAREVVTNLALAARQNGLQGVLLLEPFLPNID